MLIDRINVKLLTKLEKKNNDRLISTSMNDRFVSVYIMNKHG